MSDISVRDKLILARNIQHDVDRFMNDVVRDYVDRLKTFKASGFFERNPQTHKYRYINHDFPYYGTQPYFNITLVDGDSSEQTSFKVPSELLMTTNEGWCRDWRITLSKTLQTTSTPSHTGLNDDTRRDTEEVGKCRSSRNEASQRAN